MDHKSHHSHSHTHSVPEGKDRNLILLQYTLDHNEHHASELEELAASLREAGKEEAAGKVERAREAFEEGNTLLREAIRACGA